MIGIREDDLGVQLFEVTRIKRLHGSLCANGHEHWRLNLPVR
jgi:hypothetical protein